MTRKAQIIGRNAEERVIATATQLGLNVRPATPEEDYGGKTDVVIEGQPAQISSSRKSKNQQKLLTRAGIRGIVAGDSISKENLAEQLLALKPKR